jgi:hypothetical protein
MRCFLVCMAVVVRISISSYLCVSSRSYISGANLQQIISGLLKSQNFFPVPNSILILEMINSSIHLESFIHLVYSFYVWLLSPNNEFRMQKLKFSRTHLHLCLMHLDPFIYHMLCFDRFCLSNFASLALQIAESEPL